MLAVNDSSRVIIPFDGHFFSIIKADPPVRTQLYCLQHAYLFMADF